MATVTINNSPIHSDSILTAVYGDTGSSWSCGFHTGIDFAPTGDTPANPDLFSVVTGQVVEIHSSPTGDLGCYVVIQDQNMDYWRYCHMVEGSIAVVQGQLVDTNTKIGNMGDTGQAYGVHLHLEHATTINWSCATFLNPCDYLQIPNERGTIVLYDGSIVPTVTEELKHKFPWAILTRKYRRRRY